MVERDQRISTSGSMSSGLGRVLEWVAWGRESQGPGVFTTSTHRLRLTPGTESREKLSRGLGAGLWKQEQSP